MGVPFAFIKFTASGCSKNDSLKKVPNARNPVTTQAESTTAHPAGCAAHVQEQIGPRQLNHFNRVRSFTLSASMAPGFTLGQALDSLRAVRTLPSEKPMAIRQDIPEHLQR